MMDLLTASEMRILHLRAQGFPLKEIGMRLKVSEQTVKSHITAIYDALDVDNLPSALSKVGWLQVPDTEPPVSESCGWVGKCGRPRGHRGHHGGFREAV